MKGMEAAKSGNAASGETAWRSRARHAVAATLAAGREAYRRELALPRLLPLMPRELAEPGVEAERRIVARLARALRAERNRGKAGHWTYDLNRHIALHQAYQAERRRLAALTAGAAARGAADRAGAAAAR